MWLGPLGPLADARGTSGRELLSPLSVLCWFVVVQKMKPLNVSCALPYER